MAMILDYPPTVNSNEKGNFESSAQEMAHGPKLAERKKRTRTGCLNCSRRRRKCDEAKPNCTGCRRRGEDCQWRVLGSFRDANIKVLDSDHPSMNQGGGTKAKRQSKFKILNAAPNQAHTKEAPKPQIEREVDLSLSTPTPRGLSPSPPPNHDAVTRTIPSTESRPDHVAGHADVDQPQGLSPPLSGDVPSHASCDASHRSPHDHRGDTNGGPHETGHSQYSANLQCDFEPHQMHDDASSHAYLDSSPEYVIDGMTSSALHNLTDHNPQFQPSVSGSYQSHHSPLFNQDIFSDPVDLTNDVFLPGSTYEALHTTLRNRQLWTARPDFPAPCSSRGSISQVHTPTPFSDSDTFSRSGRESRRSRPGRFIDLSPEREHALWQNYLNEICSWVRAAFNFYEFPKLITAA